MSKFCRALIVWLLIFPITAVGQPDVARLIAGLRDANAEDRKNAFEAARAFPPEAVIPVAPLLDDANPNVRRAASLALEKIVHAASASEETRAAVARALAVAMLSVSNSEKLLALLSHVAGVESLPALFAYIDSHPDEAAAVLLALERIARVPGEAGLQDAIAAQVMERYDTFPAAAQRQAIATLAATGTDAALAWLRDQPPIPALAQALGEAGEERDVDALITAYLREKQPQYLDAALSIVERLQPKKAFGQYKGLLNDVDTEAHTPAAAAALLGIARTADNDRDARILLEYLEGDHPRLQAVAAQGLILMTPEGVTERLLRAHRRADEPLKARLLEIIAVRAPEAAVPLLEEAASSQQEAEETLEEAP